MSKDQAFVQKIDGGAANKGVARQLREGQKPGKPANLSRPAGVAVPRPSAPGQGSDKK
jgi:hypothetical protein